jgi:L-lactate dehydrogenase complex protein LldF
VEDNASLPFASSLCGACYDACPVKIDIPEVLVHLRARHVTEHREQHRLPSPEQVIMAAAGWVMAEPERYTAAQRSARIGRLLARRGRIRSLPPPLSVWTSSRDAPEPPPETFREWWARTRGDGQ